MVIMDAVFVYRLRDEDELKWHCRVHSHGEGCYELHYFMQGSGGFRVDTAAGHRVLPIAPGAAFVTKPSQIHSVRADSRADPVSYYAVLFRPEAGDSGLVELLASRIAQDKAYTVGANYRFFFEQLRERALSGDPDLAASAACQLGSFLYLLPAGGVSAHAADERNVHIERALRIMQKAVFENLELDGIAAKVGLDKSYFVRLFRGAMKETPMRYYRRLKMEAASAMLISGTAPIRAVSERMHFANEFHFSRAFKAHTGLSPLEYRKKYAQII